METNMTIRDIIFFVLMILCNEAVHSLTCKDLDLVFTEERSWIICFL